MPPFLRTTRHFPDLPRLLKVPEICRQRQEPQPPIISPGLHTRRNILRARVKHHNKYLEPWEAIQYLAREVSSEANVQ